MSDKAFAVQSFRERRPRRELRPFVTCVWMQEVAKDSCPYPYQSLPNGSSELVWELGSAPKFIGPQTPPRETLLPPGTVTIGVRFRPAAPLAAPVSELVDLEADAEAICGRWVVDVGECLLETSSLDRAADAVEAALLREGVDDAAPDPIASEFIHRLLASPTANLRTLTTALFISERQLRRRCEAAAGMSPKALQRIFRFQRFLALANSDSGHTSLDLGRLARETGYADQAHLSRETVRLAGLPPKRLLRDWQDDCSGVHDHAASRSQFRPPAPSSHT
jgi:AraC-like DNA-binding protein